MDESSEERGIRDAIAHYVDGMRTGNIETLKRGFHEQAILCGYLGDELIAAPIAALYDWVGANPAPAATGEPFSVRLLTPYCVFTEPVNVTAPGAWSRNAPSNGSVHVIIARSPSTTIRVEAVIG